MSSEKVVREYFDAWNRHDPAGVAALFVEGGTYSDPSTNGELSGDAIASYVTGMITAFPNIHFEVESIVAAPDGRVAVQWLGRATNTGPFHGGPPTGRAVSLAGAEFLLVEGGKIRNAEGYYDRKSFLDQLGLS